MVEALMTDEQIRNSYDDFEDFLKKNEVPEDMSDWKLEDWTIFAFQYLMANWDHAMEEEDEKIREGECDGCGRSITPELPGQKCHLKPNVYHEDHCWGEHLGECIEED
jgi:hypothetical protein